MAAHEFRSDLQGITWPAFPGTGGARMLAILWQLERSQWWPTERLAAHQLGELGRLLAHAYEHVPFHRGRFEQAGVAPLALDWAAFQRLPLLERRDLQENFQALQSGKLLPHHGGVMTARSSGSTGRPITFRVTEAETFLAQALSVREHLWRGRDLFARFAVIEPDTQQGERRGWDTALSAAFWTGTVVTFGIDNPIDAQVRWLRRESPTYLQTHPSNLAGLARHCIERRVRLPRLREVRTYGETLPPELRDLCREAWNVPVTDYYSSQELGPIALQCPLHEHLHVQAESVVVEVLDEDGAPCRPGAVGRVVITALHNFAMPFIRYVIGDYAEAGETCACGRGLPVLKRILGRTRNLVTLPDGSKHWPSFPSRGWLAIAPIRQLRIIQRTLASIEVQLVVPRPLTLEEQERLAAWLRGRLRHSFDIAFTELAEIPRSANGKYEDFASEVGS